MKNRYPSCSFDELMQTGPLTVTLGMTVIGEAVPRRFSTGSYGFALHGHKAIPLPGGGTAKVMCSMILTVIDSRGQNENS